MIVMTYTDDGDALNAVGEPSGLVFGVFCGHDESQRYKRGLLMMVLSCVLCCS